MKRVALLGFLILAGCSSLNQADVVGEWKGMAVSDSHTSEIEQNLRDALAGTMRLTIKSDGRFHAIVFVAPIDGNWHVDRDQLVLKPDGEVKSTGDSSSIKVDARGEIRMRRLADGKLELVDEKPTDAFRFQRQ